MAETSRDYRALEERCDQLEDELEEKSAKLVIAEDEILGLRERLDQLETQEKERNVLNVNRRNNSESRQSCCP